MTEMLIWNTTHKTYYRTIKNGSRLAL